MNDKILEELLQELQQTNEAICEKLQENNNKTVHELQLMNSQVGLLSWFMVLVIIGIGAVDWKLWF